MRNLKRDINKAIAWGVPDRECLGYTHRELTGLLRKALDRIKYLELVLEGNKVKFAQTDWEQ